MLISICSREFDPNGGVLVSALPSSELGRLSRRVNRAQTLDGGAYLNDTGQTDADRDIRVQFMHSGADVGAIKRLVSLYPLLTLSAREGCFLGVIEALSSNAGTLTLNFLVKERLDNGYTV